MTNFLTMQNRIADDLMRDDLSAQIKNAINDAIELQEGERYKFNERRYQIFTVAGQEYYDLEGPTLVGDADDPETLLEVDYVMATVGNQPYPLCQRTQQYINEWQRSTYQGQPSDFTIYGGLLRVFPLPDAVYTLDLGGLASLAPRPLSADVHENAWTNDGAGIICGQAKLLIYRDILRDSDGAALAVQQLVEAGGNPQPASARRKMAALAYTGRQRHVSL